MSNEEPPLIIRAKNAQVVPLDGNGQQTGAPPVVTGSVAIGTPPAPPLLLACVHGVLDDLGENARHVYLIASVMQAVAADVALTLRDDNPALTAAEIVAVLRSRADALDAESVRWFDTYYTTDRD